MKIAYTAHTETCTLLLDEEGICRSVLARSSAVAAGGGRGGRPTRIPASAEKCIGAQYVAAIDVREAGGMLQLPKPGAQMLFARTEKNGRITLVRSAPVIRFEETPASIDSGVHAKPSAHSAPTLVRPEHDDEPTLADPCPPSFAPPTEPERRSSIPSPPRTSGVVPAASRWATGTLIPPPPAIPRVHNPDSETRPIAAVRPPAPAPLNVPTMSAPRRPSVVRVSSPSLSSEYEVETRPFRRARTGR
jgi:hypothetical protein